MSVGWPDFTRPTAFLKQAVPIELVEQWQARLVKYFTIVVDSGIIASGASVTTDTTVPSAETWFLYQVFGQACYTRDAASAAAELWMINLTKSLYFAAMTMSRVGFHSFAFALPFPCDAGDVIRTIQNNCTAAAQRYYSGIAGYKITSSGKPEPFQAGMSLDDYLNQPGIVGLFYERGDPITRLTVTNLERQTVDVLEIEAFQTLKETVKLISSRPITERKWKRGAK